MGRRQISLGRPCPQGQVQMVTLVLLRSGRETSKRRKWIRQVYAQLDILDLPVQPEEEDDASWQFNLEKRSAKKLSYLIYKGVSSQLSKINRSIFDPERAHKKKFDPVTAYTKSYHTTEPDHRNLKRPHSVSSLIIDEIKDQRSLHCSNPSPDALLAGSQDVGKAEKLAVQQQLFAQTSFRISNALSLSLQACNSIVDKSRQEIASFRSMSPLTDVPQGSLCMSHIRDRENAVSQMASQLTSSLSSLSQGIQEVSLCSADLFNMQANNYIQAVRARRKAWLDASSLPKSVKEDIHRMPIQVFQAGEQNPPDLIGPQGNIRIKEAIEARDKRSKQVISQLAMKGAAQFKTPNQPPPSKKQQKQQKGQKGQSQSQSPSSPYTYKSPLPNTSNTMSFQSGPSQQGGRGGGRGANQSGRGKKSTRPGQANPKSNQ